MNTAAGLALLSAVCLASASVWAPEPWDIASAVFAAICAGLSLLLFSVARHSRAH